MSDVSMRILGGHQSYRGYAVQLGPDEREIQVLVACECDRTCNPEQLYGVTVFAKLSKERFEQVVRLVQQAHARQLAKWGRKPPRWEAATTGTADEATHWLGHMRGNQ